MQDQIKQLIEWASVMKAYHNDVPTGEIPKEVWEMRFHTLLEEVHEYHGAASEGNIVEIADALCDIMYFLIGTIHAHGLQDFFEKCFSEVHRSNMSKCHPDGSIIYREDGKVLKGPSYSKPDLRSIIYAKE